MARLTDPPAPAPVAGHAAETPKLGEPLFRASLLSAWRTSAGPGGEARELWELWPAYRGDADLRASFDDGFAFLARYPLRCFARPVARLDDDRYVVAAPPWLSLAALRDRAPLPIALIAAIVRELAIDLAQLPDDVVIRALSARAIAIAVTGEIRVLDTTLARFAPRRAVTHSGVIKGELAQMSPELVSGFRFDARADVFSLGTIAFELATGARPFSARGAEPMEQIHANRLADLRDPAALDALPPVFAATLRAMLARDPDERIAVAAIPGALASIALPVDRVWAAVSAIVPDAARDAILYAY